MTKISLVVSNKSITVEGCDLFSIGPYVDEREAKSSARNLKFGSYVRGSLCLTEAGFDKLVVLTRNKFLGYYVGLKIDGDTHLYVDFFDSKADAMTRVERLMTDRPKSINVPVSIA